VLYREGAFADARDRARTAASQSRVVTERAVAAASRFTDSTLVAGWRRMVSDTVAWSQRTGGVAVVVFKDSHRLTVYDNGKPVRSFSADMGLKSVNDKQHAGDSATPEGRYTITAKKGAGKSTYYKALLLDYPNAEDRATFERMKRAGRIPRGARLGGMIEIHGEGGRGKDWTRGCVALSNSDIDVLFTRVGVGTPVTIVGGDGNGGMFTELVRQSAPAAERAQ
jgi:L,D-peptidoglycan transpeptidase YkuD (ErfK/YbiS/YcfS/YnhG family)